MKHRDRMRVTRRYQKLKSDVYCWALLVDQFGHPEAPNFREIAAQNGAKNARNRAAQKCMSWMRYMLALIERGWNR